MVSSSPAASYESMTYDQKARVAFMRFGLGPKPGWRGRLNGRDPREACRDELTRSTHKIVDTDIKAKGRDGNLYDLTYDNCGLATFPTISPLFTKDVLDMERAARHVKALEPEIGFVERLVLFWCNHFSVSGQSTAGHMERTAIREHVLGNFDDMLKAVVGHAAMVNYLNNSTSCGPNSQFALYRARINGETHWTYNENLAREIMELHTIGLNGGYAQADVISFAKILTGWKTYVGNVPHTGTFYFDASCHEPGTFRVMNREFPPTANGQDQGLRALEYLALHPSTAQHIAFKLLRHFVTDTPSQSSIDTLASEFTNGSGNLPRVYRKLLDLQEAWTEPLNRLRQPYHWMLAANRALGCTEADARRDAWRYGVFLSYLDQDLWLRLTPDGYPDDNYYWMTGNALRIRKNISGRLATCSVVGTRKWSDPVALATDLFGSELNEKSTQAISDLAKKNTTLAAALLLSTPVFLRW